MFHVWLKMVGYILRQSFASQIIEFHTHTHTLYIFWLKAKNRSLKTDVDFKTPKSIPAQSYAVESLFWKKNFIYICCRHIQRYWGVNVNVLSTLYPHYVQNCTMSGRVIARLVLSIKLLSFLLHITHLRKDCVMVYSSNPVCCQNGPSDLQM